MSESLKLRYIECVHNEITNTANLDDTVFLYVMLNFQYYMAMDFLCKDPGELRINVECCETKINEGQYLIACESAKKLKEFMNVLMPNIIRKMSLVLNEILLEKIEFAKIIYFESTGIKSRISKVRLNNFLTDKFSADFPT